MYEKKNNNNNNKKKQQKKNKKKTNKQKTTTKQNKKNKTTTTTTTTTTRQSLDKYRNLPILQHLVGKLFPHNTEWPGLLLLMGSCQNTVYISSLKYTEIVHVIAISSLILQLQWPSFWGFFLSFFFLYMNNKVCEKADSCQCVQNEYVSPAAGLNRTLKSLNTCEKATCVCVCVCVYVCMYTLEGIPALLDVGSPPTCHKARGVNCHKSGHHTPHDQQTYGKKNFPKNWCGLMWVSNHMLVTNSGRTSVTVRVWTAMRKKSLSGGRENRRKLVRCTDKPKQT